MLINNRVSAIVVVGLAIAFWLPISGYSAESNKRITNYRCGQTELRILKIQDGEVQRIQIAFFDSTNKETYPDLLWFGDFVSLCNVNAFVLLDTNIQHKPGLSFLMNSSPKTIASFEFGEIYSFGNSADEKLFWVQTHSLVDQRPATKLRVYSYLGAEILSRSYAKKAIETIVYDGQSYQITVLEPDLPG